MDDDGELKSLLSGPYDHRLETVQVGVVTRLRHPSSRVLFLPASHGFRAGETLRYDRKGHNVSVAYPGPDATFVSVFVFPFMRPRTHDIFIDVFAASIADMLRGLQEPRVISERTSGFAHPGGEIVPGRRCEVLVTGPRSSRRNYAFVELLAFGAWLLKIRASGPCASRALVESFVGAWLEASSFGAPDPSSRIPA